MTYQGLQASTEDWKIKKKAKFNQVNTSTLKSLENSIVESWFSDDFPNSEISLDGYTFRRDQDRQQDT